MEAEAQCCALESLGLVDGIITDDSDAFLFGAQCVYKNFFNQQQFVEAYRAADLQALMGLTRHHLIQIAYLVGSDYTEGIHGIGAVTALEIISEWCQANEVEREDEDSSGLSSLIAFAEWWRALASGQCPDHEPTSLREKLVNQVYVFILKQTNRKMQKIEESRRQEVGAGQRLSAARHLRGVHAAAG